LLTAVSQALLERAKMGPRYHAGIRQAGAEHSWVNSDLIDPIWSNCNELHTYNCFIPPHLIHLTCS
jgi:hypothetical protein